VDSVRKGKERGKKGERGSLRLMGKTRKWDTILLKDQGKGKSWGGLDRRFKRSREINSLLAAATDRSPRTQLGGR